MEIWAQLGAQILPQCSFHHIFPSSVHHFCIPPVCSPAPRLWSLLSLFMCDKARYFLTTDPSAPLFICARGGCYINGRLEFMK